MCNSKAVKGELYTCTNEGTGKHAYIIKSSRQAGKMYGETKRNMYGFYTYLYVCVCTYIYTTQASKMSGETRTSPGSPPKKNKWSEADGSSFWRGGL